MASYHFAVQILSRTPRVDPVTGKGRPGASAVSAAAYRAREVLKDERTGRTEDYRRKGGLQRAEIMLPEGAAPWLADRARLWNHVEATEKRKDAQLAREINLALPHELTDEQRYELVRSFVRDQFVSEGMVADIAWHKPVPESGDDPRNFHAHIMLTLRQATETGLRRVKTREWNGRGRLEIWREEWRDYQNSMLREAGHKARVDHRSLTEQREEAWLRGDRRAAAMLDRNPGNPCGAACAQDCPAPGAGGKPQARGGAPRRRPTPHDFGYVSRAEWEARRRAERRQRDYPRFDDGTRLDWLTNILLGNDQHTKALLVKRERQMARLQRKMDYWLARMTYQFEGQLRGKQFRWQRAQKAAAEREARLKAEREREHARVALRSSRSWCGGSKRCSWHCGAAVRRSWRDGGSWRRGVSRCVHGRGAGSGMDAHDRSFSRPPLVPLAHQRQAWR